jgi:hypothetical protein
MDGEENEKWIVSNPFCVAGNNMADLLLMESRYSYMKSIASLVATSFYLVGSSDFW